MVFHKTPEDALPKDFLVRYTYNTNAIEGNRLTLRQTALVLSDKIAPEGARTNDVIEALNSLDAWEFVKKYKGKLNKKFVCKVQYEITKNTTTDALKSSSRSINSLDSHFPLYSEMAFFSISKRYFCNSSRFGTFLPRNILTFLAFVGDILTFLTR